MSITVSPDELPAVLAELAPDAFVVTTSDDRSPKVVHAMIVAESDGLHLDAGRGTAANLDRGSPVTLIFPPAEPGAMSLLVDGTGRRVGDGDAVVVTPGSAVWHRAAS